MTDADADVGDHGAGADDDERRLVAEEAFEEIGDADALEELISDVVDRTVDATREEMLEHLGDRVAEQAARIDELEARLAALEDGEGTSSADGDSDEDDGAGWSRGVY